MTHRRITTDPAQLGGQPCIPGIRIPVASVVAMVADGRAVSEIIDAFPALEPEDVNEARHLAPRHGANVNCRSAAGGKLLLDNRRVLRRIDHQPLAVVAVIERHALDHDPVADTQQPLP